MKGPPYPFSRQETKQEEEERLVLESNPLEWTVTDVVRFIKLTDCAPLAKIFQEQVRLPSCCIRDVLFALLIELAFWDPALAGERVPPCYCGGRGGWQPRCTRDPP